MPLMSFREPNMVKWRGVRPGHNGEQILKGNGAVNASVIIHTVTVGKKLYLAEWNMGFFAVAVGYGALYIRNNLGAFVRYLALEYLTAGAPGVPIEGCSNPPIELPSQYVIYVESGAAVLTVFGGIFGWEE